MLFVLPILPKLMFEKSTRETKRNKGGVALFGHISHHPNVLSLATDLGSAITDAQQAQNITYPSSNTIKSCIYFTWRS